MNKKVKIEIKNNEIIKASSSYLKELDCYEVELIKNDTPADTIYKIEFIDDSSINNITLNELRGLKKNIK